jgi:hypothetical protein
MIAVTVVIRSGRRLRAGQHRNIHVAEAAEKRYPASFARSPQLVSR